jgi:hypothetical protein
MYYTTTNKTNNPLMMLKYFNAQSYRTLQRCLTTLVLLLSLFVGSYAQQKGIDGNLQILSPYPVYISDFASLTMDRLKLMVRSNEFMNSGTTDYRLRIVLEKGNSIIAQSDVASNLSGVSNFKLLPNVPYNFTTAELAPYFSLVNLNGINETNYIEPLTEGVYRLSFLVYGAKSPTGPWTLMSDAISQQFWIVQNDPPLLNTPTNGDIIESEGAVMINFQWIPRAIQTATRHEYEFTLVEIGAANADNPYVSFNNNANKPTAVKRTVSVSALAISATELGLVDKKTYAWRVRVKSLGIDSKEVINYKNEGYSDIFVFSYKRSCAKPTGLVLEAKSSDLVFANWNLNAKHLSYRVVYRKYSTTAPFEWVTENTITNVAKLSQLEPNTEYEVMVGGLCGENLLNYCDPVRVKTLAKDTIKDVICGVFNRPELANTTPIASLKVTDIITAGDFPITITKVTGSNGVFTGEGFVASPWLGFVPFKVKFQGITVNTDKRLVNGYIETEYDPTWKNILDINAIFEGGGSVGSVKTGLSAAENTVDFVIKNASDITVTLTPLGQDGTSQGATITVKGVNGETKQITVDKLPTTIQDREGKIYAIDKNGQVSLVGKTVSLNMSNEELNDLDKEKGVVTFSKHGFYAFDAFEEVYEKDVLWQEQYQKIKDYRVARKAIAPGKPDVIKAKIVLTDNTLKPDSVRFVTSAGMQFEKKSLGNGEYEISIVGGSGGDAQELFAIYPLSADKKISLGKILLLSYTTKKPKLVLVPVNGATVNSTAIAKKINEIYNPVAVDWEVSVAPNFVNNAWDLNRNGLLDIEGSGLFSMLTPEMKALNNAYQAATTVTKDKIYLFVLSGAATPNVAGDMPRGQQFGYLFANFTGELGQTAAHEIGHGVFKLKHTFDGYFFKKDDLLNNLMNYDGGTFLARYQWDLIHNPGIVIGLFESDVDAQLNLTSRKVPDLKETLQVTYHLIAPSGQGFDATANNIEDWRIERYPAANNPYIITSIKKDGKNYEAKYNGNVFIGYKTSDGSPASITYVTGKCKAVVWLDTWGSACQGQYQVIDNWESTARADKTKCIDDIKAVLYNNKWQNALWKGASGNSDECRQTVPVYATKELQGTGFLQQMQQLFENTVGKKNKLTGQDYTFGMSVRLSKESDKNISLIRDNVLIWEDGKEVSPQENEIILWIVQTADGKYKIKSILFNEKVSVRIQKSFNQFGANVNWEAKSLIEKVGTISYVIEDTYANILYDMLDGMASGIKWLKIPKQYYDCKDPKYNKIYAEVFSLLDISKYLENFIINEIKVAYPDFKKEWEGVNSQQIKFAFFCGMYNGVVDVVASVPEFINLFIMPISSQGRADFTSKYEQFSQMAIVQKNASGGMDTICKPGQFKCKMWELVKQGIYDQFGNVVGQPCQVAESIGGIIGPIIVIYIGDVAAGGTVVERLASSTAKVIKFCDDFTDIFKVAKISINFEKINNKLFVVLKKATDEVIRQVSDTKFRIKAYLDGLIEEFIEVEEFQLAAILRAAADGSLLEYGLTHNGKNYKIRLDLLMPKNAIELVQKRVADILGIDISIIKKLNEEYKIPLETLKRMQLNGERAKRILDMMSKLSVEEAKDFAKDLADNPNFAKLFTEYPLGTPPSEFLEVWKLLRDKNKKFVRVNPDLLKKLSELSPAVRDIITEFTDDIGDKSTLKKFLEALNDPDFFEFVNNPVYEKFVKGFVAHKTLTEDNFKEIFEGLGELLDEINVGAYTGKEAATWKKVQDWLERAKDVTKFKNYGNLGRELGNNIAKAIKGKQQLYKDLAQKLNISLDELAKYDVLTEVPLTTSRGFMKADVVLVKKSADGLSIEDVIIIENKLSKGTDFTLRQKEGFSKIGEGLNPDGTNIKKPDGSIKLIEMVIENNKEGLIKGNTIKIDPNKCFRISDHGKTTDAAQLTISDIEKIDYSKIVLPK